MNSINPLLKRAVVFALALGIAGPSLPTRAGSVDLGSPCGRTPYDPYLGPLWSVLGRLSGQKAGIDEVRSYVRTARGFRYYMNDPYVPQTPEQTESTRSGDCKAKSLWVTSKMDDRSVRFVMGKARRVSSISHAWLLWQGPGGWLILDPTNFGSPLDPGRLSADEFVPTYSYTQGGKYAHAVAAKPKVKYGDH